MRYFSNTSALTRGSGSTTKYFSNTSALTRCSGSTTKYFSNTPALTRGSGSTTKCTRRAELLKIYLYRGFALFWNYLDFFNLYTDFFFQIFLKSCEKVDTYLNFFQFFFRYLANGTKKRSIIRKGDERREIKYIIEYYWFCSFFLVLFMVNLSAEFPRVGISTVKWK